MQDLTPYCKNTGIGIFGGNGDIVRDNHIYDNWRDEAKLLCVPAAFRGEPDKGVDTSFHNTFADNKMGVRPDGTPDANGNDFWWDEEGKGNCWGGNTSQRRCRGRLARVPDPFGKTLWSPGRGPVQLPESELLRTGRIAYLEPGETVPFTVAWHAKDGRPAVVDYGAGSLRVPG